MRRVSLVMFILLAMLVTACGGNTPTPAPIQTAAPTKAPEPTSAPIQPSQSGLLPEVNPLEVNGNVVTAGSSTVYPLAERMAERFYDEGFQGQITNVDPNGPFAKFTTLPIQIYQWTSRPQDVFRNIAAAAIIVLVLLLLSLNASAVILRNRFSRRLD